MEASDVLRGGKADERAAGAAGVDADRLARADDRNRHPVKKSSSDSEMEQAYILMPRHINADGKLFGGQLAAWIDEIAGIVACRHARCHVVTACIDNLSFKAGAGIGDIVVLRARVDHTGHTSMEVRVDTYREDVHGTRTLMNHAYVVMVAVDGGGRPVPVPGLLIENGTQRAEWEAATRRAELRRQRRYAS